jgi:rubrerythrin
MGLLASLRRATLRLILRNALALEEEVYAHFLDLPEQLAGLELPPPLQAVVAEEREHRSLLGRLAAGQVSDEELEKALSAPDVHHLDRVEPLPPRYAPIRERLLHIAGHERAVYQFFRSLYEKSKIPLVKRAFRLLMEQEEVHVRLLELLLGQEPGGKAQRG